MNSLKFVSVIATGCLVTTAAALTYDATRPIYDDTVIKRSVDELPAVLAHAYAKGKPVVVYLHGRGEEPDKSFNPSKTGGGALPRLEKEFGVSVVMVN